MLVACLAPVGDILKTRTQQTKNKTRRFFFFLSLHTPATSITYCQSKIGCKVKQQQPDRTDRTNRRTEFLFQVVPQKKQEQQVAKTQNNSNRTHPNDTVHSRPNSPLFTCEKQNYWNNRTHSTAQHRKHKQQADTSTSTHIENSPTK